MNVLEIETGVDLREAIAWPKNHRTSERCPVCAGNVLRIALTHLVYAYESCSCDRWDYEHLTEVLYHRACYPTQVCETFEPFRIRASPHHPGVRYTAECQHCGRLEAAHVP